MVLGQVKRAGVRILLFHAIQGILEGQEVLFEHLIIESDTEMLSLIDDKPLSIP